MSAEKHPDADALLVQQIQTGKEDIRTIVSGLARFYQPEQLVGKLVAVVCNLKASKLRGIVSQGMVLAASNSDKSIVEVLEAPDGSVAGEEITFEGFGREPAATLNPKHKILEKCTEHFRTSDSMVATFKNVPFSTSAGVVTVKSLKDACIA